MSRSIAERPQIVAAGAAALALCLIGLQYAISLPDEHALREFVVVTGLIAVATAVVFGLVVPRAGSARTALALSVLGLLLSAAFWSGVAPVLAVGGIVLARRTRSSGGAARAAELVGWLALVADVALLIVGSVTS